MAEKGILFTAPMVRAILAKTKRQTRRVVKPQPYIDPQGNACWNGSNFGQDGRGPHIQSLASPIPSSKTGRVRCPYGMPGDRLWVREAWMPDPPCDGTWGYTAWAGNRIGQIAAVPERFQHPAFCNYRASWQHGTDGLRWTPGIHMPRWASRITLEITDVRVERLQDITEANVVAEGIQRWPLGFRVDVSGAPVHECRTFAVARDAYRWLWEEINGPGSWDANPWIWVFEFERVKAKGSTP
jgi:hypothetical protein